MRGLTGAVAIALTCLLFCAACTGQSVTTEPDLTAPAPTEAPPAEEARPSPQLPPGFESAEAALSARDAWLARGISTYSYTAQLFLTAPPDSTDEPSCGSSGGLLTVRVLAGTPVEARVSDVPCVVDLTKPNRIPLTFAEWFNRLFDQGADSLAIDFELGQLGEPQSLFTEGLAGSIQFELTEFTPGSAEPDSVAPTTTTGNVESALATWTASGITDYEMTVVRVCRCTEAFRGPFDVSVAGGEVVAVTLNGSPIDPTAEDTIAPDSLSVDGLLASVADLADADRLDVIFDPERGIPVVVLADPRLGTADDEIEVRVVRFEPRPAPVDPITAALNDLGGATGDAPSGSTSLDGARFCGVDRADWNDDFIGGDPIARACLTDGFERNIASVLVQAGPTVEGDLIINVIRANGDGTIDVFADATQDQFGSGGWSSATCTGLTQRPDVGTNFFNVDC